MGNSSVILILLGISISSSLQFHPLSDEFIQSINEINPTWQAGRNFPENISMNHIIGLMGVRRPSKYHVSYVKPAVHLNTTDKAIPISFDARQQWPHCPTISQISDVGSCGSCWAFGAVESMSDRICIHSNGVIIMKLSANELLACCWQCGSGCGGGFIDAAWEYWVTTGIVSGGSYGSEYGCQPYINPPCEHYVNGSRKACDATNGHTPKCDKTCQELYPIPYEEDFNFGRQVYSIHRNATQVQIEIMTNGPVETYFNLYEDFLHYKSGVYEYVKGYRLGNYAVRILGWGVENDIPYWLMANSWNTDWGDQGYFKIRRGENHCDVEELVLAGLPKLTQ